MTAARVGFTGTRDGLTLAQLDALNDLFVRLIDRDMFAEFHHGDCVGADATAHYLASFHMIPVIIHPPVNQRMRAFCAGAYRMRTAREYGARNRQIVSDTDLLIATPNSDESYRGSGTWATIRHAQDEDRPIFIIYPDGRVTFEMSVDPDEFLALEDIA